jgi:hypothetical protein
MKHYVLLKHLGGVTKQQLWWCTEHPSGLEVGLDFLHNKI